MSLDVLHNVCAWWAAHPPLDTGGKLAVNVNSGNSLESAPCAEVQGRFVGLMPMRKEASAEVDDEIDPTLAARVLDLQNISELSDDTLADCQIVMEWFVGEHHA